MALSATQKALLAKVYATPQFQKASPKAKKALVEAGIVESGLRNLNYGDRDSKGFLQQRPSSGYTAPTNVQQATIAFLSKAAQANRPGQSAGELAQAVQRSAFPGRYGEQSSAANAILSGASGTVGRGSTPAPKAMIAQAQPDNSGLIAAYLAQQGNPDALVSLAAGLLDQGQPAPSQPSSSPPSSGSPKKGGVAEFDGKPVAAWIKPVLDYARQHGWKGTVTSGVRSDADQTRIYRSGVRPAAVPKSMGGAGSKHEQTGFLQGAVDVTDAKTLSKILKAKGSRLQYAGAKDPVHFSVPNPNGTY